MFAGKPEKARVGTLSQSLLTVTRGVDLASQLKRAERDWLRWGRSLLNDFPPCRVK